ncbi:type 4a pilus biogenesis protein PilO [Marinospirillum perlucidum]|uniref:type 4a pilus biogenesis protein PilO n=1 Tax=Marinospirillum perlucidum TaxID=1982602 RepID=UPI000DF15DC3|nr:type 4a pilus biogenesis protein PilO [Marinospirillum perlucidum]
MKLTYNLQPLKSWLASQGRAIRRLEKDDLELQRAGQWPDALKGLALLGILLLVMFASNWLLISQVRDQVDQLSREQEELFEQYQLRAFQAANLTAYQQQMRAMESVFQELLSRLPIQREIPRLIEDIQNQAARQGITLQAVNLRDEEKRDFYTELPFEIRAQGSYHNLAAFISGISRQDRIITLHDFILTPAVSGQPTVMNLTLQARTYRYDEDQQASSGGNQ